MHEKNRFSTLIHFFRPHKTVPITPWRAQSLWDLSVKRVLILSSGLILFGLGDALVIQSNIGNAPWTVLAQGISIRSGLSIGWTTFLVSVTVLLIWIPLKVKPGFGTLANIVLIASAIEFGAQRFPLQSTLLAGIASALLGILLVGIGTAMYITCGLGPGPRDGAMTGIHHRTGVRVGRVRLGIEVSVLIAGALLGGRVGLGTALFALLMGQVIAISLGVVARLTQNSH